MSKQKNHALKNNTCPYCEEGILREKSEFQCIPYKGKEWRIIVSFCKCDRCGIKLKDGYQVENELRELQKLGEN